MKQENQNNFSIVLIVVLGLILCVVGSYLYFNPFKDSSISELEKKNNDIDIKVKEIQLLRDSLKNLRDETDDIIDSLENVSTLRSDSIKKLSVVSQKYKREIANQREKIQVFDDMLRENEKQIVELKKNPIVIPKNQLVSKLREKI